MKIRDVMTTDVRTAEKDSTIEHVAQMMRDEDVGAIPIMEAGELAGMITDRDIVVRCVAEGLDSSDTSVESILGENLVSVEPETDVERAARLMADHQVRRLPVMKEGELMGIVSLGDLAVKTDQDEQMGKTLEQISEGVRASGKTAMKARKQDRAKAQSQPVAKQAGSRSPGIVGGGRQQAMEQNAGRRTAGTRGRSRADVERGEVRGVQATGSKQGAAKRAAGAGQSRQSKVVNISDKGRRAPRRKAS